MPVPHYCPVCKSKENAYYGRLVFSTETEKPICPNHKAGVLIFLVAVVRRGLDGAVASLR